jgi:hypothetical protein
VSKEGSAEETAPLRARFPDAMRRDWLFPAFAGLEYFEAHSWCRSSPSSR